MTIGVCEFALFIIIWAATTITITALAISDAIRRRRDRWRRHIQLFDGRP